MILPEVYQSPDGSGLAVETSDGEFIELGRNTLGSWDKQGMIEVIPDSWSQLVPSPQMGRVFLPGETVPGGVPVISYDGNVFRNRRDRVMKAGWAIEIVLPSAAALEQHVERRRWVDQMMEKQR
jgi:hypothetical protein